LRLEVKGCDGEVNAYYKDASITVCYEFLEDMWRSANSPRRPSVIAREDAVIGPFVDVFLHEAGHALFDLLKIPLLGREEDAADQLAGYYMLQFSKETKRRLIVGAAYAYASNLNVRRARDLYKRRLEVGRHITFADEHGSLSNAYITCSASPTDLTRACSLTWSKRGTCPRAGRRSARASTGKWTLPFHTLIAPHMDGAR
jgi:hypothetical protein